MYKPRPGNLALTSVTPGGACSQQRIDSHGYGGNTFRWRHIKMSVVVSDIFGMSGRSMLTAMVEGERDPQVLANLAR